MIEGFQFEVKSETTATRLDAMIAHHEKRLALIEAEVAKASARPVDVYQEHIDQHAEEHHGRDFGGGDGPRPSAEKFKDHVVHALKLAASSRRNQIERLRFMREHLVPNETFRVGWVELGHLFQDSRDHGGYPTCFGHIHDEDDEDGLDYFGVRKDGA